MHNFRNELILNYKIDILKDLKSFILGGNQLLVDEF